MLRLMAAGSAVAFGAALAGSLAGRWRLEQLAPRPAAPDAPSVSVVVPARNEQRDIAATVAGLAAQDHPRLEVLAVDDCSSDGTAAEIALAAAGDDRIRLVAGSEPPAGWLGKPWACWQGAREARGEWL